MHKKVNTERKKRTYSEKEYVKGIVHNLSFQRLTDQRQRWEIPRYQQFLTNSAWLQTSIDSRRSRKSICIGHFTLLNDV
jgi:hypothetical protein